MNLEAICPCWKLGKFSGSPLLHLCNVCVCVWAPSCWKMKLPGSRVLQTWKQILHVVFGIHVRFFATEVELPFAPIMHTCWDSVLTAIFQVNLVSRWFLKQRMMEVVVSGDNWSYKSCKAPVKSSPSTNKHPVFYKPDALPVAQPTVSKHWRENVTFHGLAYPKLTWGSSNFISDH